MKSHRPYVAALAAALLACPVTSLAQQKARALAPVTKTSPAAAPKPAPAPAPTAEPAPAPFDERGPWRGGLVVGFEKDSDAKLQGPRVQVELERDLVPLGARGQLSFVAAAAWFRGTRSDSVSAAGFTIKTDTVQNLFEVVPGFRASFALAPRLRLFGEIGVGGGRSTLSVEAKMSPGSFPTVKSSTDAGFGTLRLAAGGSYQVTPRLRVGVLLPAWSKRYGSEGSSSTLSFSALCAYAF